MKAAVQSSYINRAYTYPAYRKMLDELMAEGKTTGENQEQDIIEYAKLNIARMNRLDKTIQLVPQTLQAVAAIKEPQHWFVLTEGWCGDAAQIVPVFYALATVNTNIHLHLLLRDENLELMDQYLQNGKSRSIPKLVVTNDNLEELFNWGPRPQVLQAIYDEARAQGKTKEDIAVVLHTWYNENKTVEVQKEITALLLQHNA